ncbi:MAG: apolipoprotein N-acyltransferase [Methylococcales bacterium]|nr:apolipoprotein N-acyltransferase [Methylococcales bacterium]
MRFLSKWQWEIISPLAGLFLTLAFAPFDYSYLSVISLAYIFFAWLDCSPSRVFLRGYLYGLGLFGSGISWVYISIHDYGGAPVLGAVLLTIAVVCFWALFPALAGYLSVKIAGHKYKNRLIWIIPLVWVLVEYVRGYWLLNGFPWLQIAYTQLETPLKGFSPLVGVYGMGFLLALTASLLAAGLKKYIKPIRILISIILLWGVGAYCQTIKWTAPIGKEIKVSLIQGNIAQDQKWQPQNRVSTLLSYQQMSAQNWDSDVIVWPETAIPAYFSQVKEFYLDPLSVKAKAHNTDLIVGLPINSKKNEYSNAVITLGMHEARYYKNHLLPFGEYLPLQPLSGFILKALNIQLGNFTPGGNNQKLLIAGGYPFSTSICYEDVFGGEIVSSLPEAAYLVNVTNDGWFGDSIEPYQHMQIAQMRAVETGRYLLRSTNTGVTAIVAPDGVIIDKAPMFTKTVLKGSIYPMGGLTPYARLGDSIVILTLFLGLVIIRIKL